MNLPKPTLSRDEAMELWISERSEYAKEQVVLNNVGLIRLVLKILIFNSFDEDLFAIGLVGLCNAINKFDKNNGVKFSTYAVRAIRNEILKSLGKKRSAPLFYLDEPCKLDNGDEGSYVDLIADKKTFEEEVIANIQYEEIMNLLSDREKKIVSLRVGGKTQQEIADIYEISPVRVSQILRKIQKKFKKEFDH